MSNEAFREILNQWARECDEQEDLSEITVKLKMSDALRLKALAETFDIRVEDITVDLLHQAIDEIETAMPYQAGNEVIRVEDGLEIYNDAGPTPRYVAALQRLSKNG
ncbi:MAG: hypothetical protein ACWA5K_09390 [bacterium]